MRFLKKHGYPFQDVGSPELNRASFKFMDLGRYLRVHGPKVVDIVVLVTQFSNENEQSLGHEKNYIGFQNIFRFTNLKFITPLLINLKFMN